MSNTIEELKNNNIGVFDSGVGGISVLKDLTAVLPGEDFIFFGDSANAPYGEKSRERILELSLDVANRLTARNVKAIVIACNTATSVAVTRIRQLNPGMPVIGMEPAIKPAVIEKPGSRILVMATPATLNLDKYKILTQRFSSDAEFIPLACTGLAGRIEQGGLDCNDLKELLQHLLSPYVRKVDGIVLGCTHYPFVKRQIRDIMGDIPFYDGGNGTARQLRNRLNMTGRLRDRESGGHVTFMSSRATPEELDLYEQFFNMDI